MNKRQDRLTAGQAEALAPYEPYFGTAIRSGYCSYPGQAAIDNMQNVWTALTGSRYPVGGGCSTCLFHLVRDLGTLYYAYRDAEAAEKAAQGAAKAAAQPKPAPAPKKAQNAKKTASNAKKPTQNAKK